MHEEDNDAKIHEHSSLQVHLVLPQWVSLKLGGLVGGDIDPDDLECVQVQVLVAKLAQHLVVSKVECPVVHSQQEQGHRCCYEHNLHIVLGKEASATS